MPDAGSWWRRVVRRVAGILLYAGAVPLRGRRASPATPAGVTVPRARLAASGIRGLYQAAIQLPASIPAIQVSGGGGVVARGCDVVRWGAIKVLADKFLSPVSFSRLGRG
jgi:hypothetical protein